jgi:hypothetical protein
VVLHGPLSGAYSRELTTYLHNSQDLLTVKKGDFFLLFWAAWQFSFSRENVLSSFKSTGILPMDPEVILQRFTPATTNEPESPLLKQLTEECNGATY